MDNKFRLLRADEIECRVGQVQKDGFTLLLYKDARCDMDILDETVGSDNWQRDHKEIKGNLYCGVSIWDKDKYQWITKWDCGTESNTEKEKGEASDSFKRANVNWGIGRELYTSPKIKVKGHLKEYNGKSIPDLWKMSVSSIGYNENNEINHLVIEGDGEIIFEYSNGYSKQPKPTAETTNAVKTDELSSNTKTAVKTQFTPSNEAQVISPRDIEYAQNIVLKYGAMAGRKLGDLSMVELQVVACGTNEFLKKYSQLLLNAMNSGLIAFDGGATDCEKTPF